MSSPASPSASSSSSSSSSSDESTGHEDGQQAGEGRPMLSIEDGSESGDNSSDSPDSPDSPHSIQMTGQSTNDANADNDSDYVKSESDSEVEIHRIDRKRSLTSAFSEASSTVPEHSASTAQPRKRRRRKALNPLYVDLLNDDIEDARRRYVPDDWPRLQATQATSADHTVVWDEAEKELFYEALSRLGRDDVAGITKRLAAAASSSSSTKSEVEVRQYLHVLDEDARARRARLRNPLLPPPLSAFPAAVETSSRCCAALDVEADLVVQREAREEAKAEMRAWGPHWRVSGANCGPLSRAALALAGVADEGGEGEAGEAEEENDTNTAELRPAAVPVLSLLHAPNMLLLAERVFMNGVAQDANYVGLGLGLGGGLGGGDAELPAVQMSALRDLHDLVVALTRRLVATAVHMSQSRDRALQADSFKRLSKNVVHPSDVDAAVAALGLQPDVQAFWARCPRRLGLHVSRNAAAFVDGDDGDGDDDLMTYSEVENELLGPEPRRAIQADDDEPHDSDSSSDSCSDSDSDTNTNNDTMEARITREADEVLVHAATGFPDNLARARDMLRHRIAEELKAEAYADAVDVHRSRADELYLWRVLGKNPPAADLAAFDPDAPVTVAGFSATAKRFPVEQVIDTGRDWRQTLQYEAEWEDEAAAVQQLVDEDEQLAE